MLPRTFEGVVDVFSRSSTGTLAFAECIGSEVGCKPAGPANALGGADSLALSADGTSLYVGSEDSLDTFSREPSTGALTYESCIGEDKGCIATTPADAVVGIRSVAVSPDGNSVYAANGAFGVVDVFSREPSTGALTYESCIGNATGSECTTKIPNGALGDAESLAVSADGTSVYEASIGFPGPGGVVAFSRNTSTGALTYQGCFGSKAKAPKANVPRLHPRMLSNRHTESR